MDLVNYHKFTKVSSAKIPCSILNNIINVQIHRMCCIVPKFAPTVAPMAIPDKSHMYITGNYRLLVEKIEYSKLLFILQFSVSVYVVSYCYTINSTPGTGG